MPSFAVFCRAIAIMSSLMIKKQNTYEKESHRWTCITRHRAWHYLPNQLYWLKSRNQWEVVRCSNVWAQGRQGGRGHVYPLDPIVYPLVYWVYWLPLPSTKAIGLSPGFSVPGLGELRRLRMTGPYWAESDWSWNIVNIILNIREWLFRTFSMTF